MRRRAQVLSMIIFGMALPLTARSQQAQLARSLAATCAPCHGTNGRGQGEIASLAGLPKQKFTAALADFQTGAREATVMQQIAKGYSDDQIRLMANFFSELPSPK